LLASVDGSEPLLGNASELLLFHTGKSASGPDLELVAEAPARERAPAPVAALPKLDLHAAPKVPDAERLAALAALGKGNGDRPSAPEEKDGVYGQVVDRFIQYDVGLLSGSDGQTALMNFQNLGPDSIRAVVYGLNKSATIEASCPIYVISRKLITLLQACDDLETLAYARSHIGQGVGYSIHGASVQAVRQVAEQRYQA